MKNTHPIDVLVGKNLRSIRALRGCSQQQLAEAVDVSFQQIQKYEKGTNRISASRLWQFAEYFGVPVESFFKDLMGDIQTTVAKDLKQSENSGKLPELTPADLRVALRLNDLPPEARNKISALIETLAKIEA